MNKMQNQLSVYIISFSLVSRKLHFHAVYNNVQLVKTVVATQRATDILNKITQIPLYFNKSARGENYSRQILFKSIPFVKFDSTRVSPVSDHIFHGELAIFRSILIGQERKRNELTLKKVDTLG